MGFLFAFAVVYLIVVIVIVYFCVKTGREDSKLRNLVNNTDASMSQYCYVLDFDQQEMIRRLSVPNFMTRSNTRWMPIHYESPFFNTESKRLHTDLISSLLKTEPI